MKRKRVQVSFDGEISRTKQEFKAECDLNQIMKKFKKVAGSDFLNSYNGIVGGRFGDFSEVPDYRSALDIVKRAEATFGALPSKVRARFGNDAAEFLDFVGNPANKDELVVLGLSEPKVQKPEESVSSPKAVV